MTKEKVFAAANEAKRFLEAVKEMNMMNPSYEGQIIGTKYSSAVRRASMDLTRALARMREY